MTHVSPLFCLRTLQGTTALSGLGCYDKLHGLDGLTSLVDAHTRRDIFSSSEEEGKDKDHPINGQDSAYQSFADRDCPTCGRDSAYQSFPCYCPISNVSRSSLGLFYYTLHPPPLCVLLFVSSLFMASLPCHQARKAGPCRCSRPELPDPALGPAIALPGLGCLSGLFTSSYKLKQATPPQ